MQGSIKSGVSPISRIIPAFFIGTNGETFEAAMCCYDEPKMNRLFSLESWRMWQQQLSLTGSISNALPYLREQLQQ